MNKDLIIVIGAYGSGKSEYSINLAQLYNKRGEPVTLVDLDVVNPYFRSRDVRDYFSRLGIDVISPDGGFGHADLPMISPRIAGTIRNYEQNVILDVGGDPAGCRTLGRFVEDIRKRGYEMHFVVNTFRPFTSNNQEISEMMNMLESVSGLRISEIIANINLMDETTPEMVKSGMKILDETAKQSGIAFNTYLVLEDMESTIEDNINQKKRMLLNYYLRNPWEIVHHSGI